MRGIEQRALGFPEVEMSERFSDSRNGFTRYDFSARAFGLSRNAWASQVTHENPGSRWSSATFLEHWFVWFWAARLRGVSCACGRSLWTSSGDAGPGSQTGIGVPCPEIPSHRTAEASCRERVQSRVVQIRDRRDTWKRSGRCDPPLASLLRALRHFVPPVRAARLRSRRCAVTVSTARDGVLACVLVKAVSAFTADFPAIGRSGSQSVECSLQSRADCDFVQGKARRRRGRDCLSLGLLIGLILGAIGCARPFLLTAAARGRRPPAASPRRSSPTRRAGRDDPQGGRPPGQGRGPPPPRGLDAEVEEPRTRPPRAREAARETRRPARPEARAHQQEGTRVRDRPALPGRAAGGAQPQRTPRSSSSWPSSARCSTGSPSSRPRRPASLLLRRLEDDLRHEVGGLILKHEQMLTETAPAEGPRDPRHRHPALRRRRTPPRRPSAPSTSPPTT